MQTHVLSAEPAQRFARLVLRLLHDRQRSYSITSDIKGSAGSCQHFPFFNGQTPSHRSLAFPVSYSSYSNDSGSTVILIGSSFQMSLTYSWMVLSEENFPLDAIFRIALFAQSLWLW